VNIYRSALTDAFITYSTLLESVREKKTKKSIATRQLLFTDIIRVIKYSKSTTDLEVNCIQ
jgi:hypothetical protein